MRSVKTWTLDRSTFVITIQKVTLQTSKITPGINVARAVRQPSVLILKVWSVTSKVIVNWSCIAGGFSKMTIWAGKNYIRKNATRNHIETFSTQVREHVIWARIHAHQGFHQQNHGLLVVHDVCNPHEKCVTPTRVIELTCNPSIIVVLSQGESCSIVLLPPVHAASFLPVCSSPLRDRQSVKTSNARDALPWSAVPERRGWRGFKFRRRWFF